MPAEPARHALVTAVAAGGGALDNFVLRGDTIAGAQVTRFDLVEEMAGLVSVDVLKSVDALTQKQFLTYDPSYQTSTSQVLVEDLDQIPELAAVDAEIRRGDVAYAADGPSVVAMAHAIGHGGNRVVAYRLKGPGIATRRSRGFTLIPRDGVYRPVGGDVLFYEPRFDAFTCAGVVYFTTVTLIQTKLRADDKARQLAKDTLAAVISKLTIDGFADLEKAVMDDPSMRAKMASVSRLIQTDSDYAKNLTTNKLVKFVETNPDYDIPLTTLNGKKVLAFDPSPQHRHQIPRLLADDYLHSFLTDRNYEAGSKQRLQK